MDICAKKSALHGELSVCGSKSHTIRAVTLAALTQGKSVIRNPLTSSDAFSALYAVRALGAEVEAGSDHWIVTGKGKRLSVPENYIDTGNSGTATFFLMAVAALLNGYTVITGDEQIRRRPVIEMAEQLKKLGADVRITRPGNHCPPVIVGGPARGGSVRFCGKNSQYVSGILMIAPLLEGNTEIWIDEPWEKPYLQLTIDWMKRYGVQVINEGGEYKHFIIEGNQHYVPCEQTVPADWSGVLFPLTAAVLTDSELVISGVDFRDSQGDKAIVDHLIAMGADIRKDTQAGRLVVHGGRQLHGLEEIDLKDTPDSLPILSLAAACAQGKTTFTGLAHVRVKESDRVAVMEALLREMGCQVYSDASTMTVVGGQPLRGITANSHGDHRIAMTMAVAGMLTEQPVTILNASCAGVSFPGFYEKLGKAGACFEEKPG